jgi:hypothetical protein
MLTTSTIKDIITFLFTLSGLIIASMGLSTWKKQIKGTKYFDTAYSLHYSILKLRDAIKHVRNRGIWPAESAKAIEDFKNKYPDRVDEVDIKKNSSRYVYQMRWEEIASAYTEMESHLLAAEVLWGPEILKKILPLKQKVTKLNITLKYFFDPELVKVMADTTDKYMKLHDIVYDQSIENNDDTFSKEVNDSIKEIDEYIQQKLK